MWKFRWRRTASPSAAGTVNAGKITAEFKKGVLRITLPKTAEGKVGKRHIAVTGG